MADEGVVSRRFPRICVLLTIVGGDNQLKLIKPGPPLVSVVEGVPNAALGVKESVPVKAGAAPVGVTCTLKAILSALTPLFATSVIGIITVPPAVPLDGATETTPCTVPFCVTTTSCPAITIVAVSALDGFAASVKETVPLPLPADPEVIVR